MEPQEPPSAGPDADHRRALGAPREDREGVGTPAPASSSSSRCFDRSSLRRCCSGSTPFSAGFAALTIASTSTPTMSPCISCMRWRTCITARSPSRRSTLTSDFDRLDRVLSELANRAPDGSTHLAAAIDQGTIELIALRGARSTPRVGALPAMVVFTDGLPTLPYGPGYEKDNIRAVRRALARASRAGIECHLLALGPDAETIASLDDDVEMTGGTLIHVRDPDQLESQIHRLAQSLSPRRPLPTVLEGEQALAGLEGTWGWPPNTGREGLACTDNPHTIEFSEDRRIMIVRYEHAIDRGEGTTSSETRFRVMEQRRNFVRIEEEDAADAASDDRPSSAPLRVLADSYCMGWSSLCAQRCR